MRASDPPLIQVCGLFHTYLPGTPLEAPSLRGIDMEVHSGESVGIVGATGSGKSTLLQHLNGLLRPEKGTVQIGGVSTSDPHVDIRAIRMRIGLVFQNPEDQLFERYAGDDVAFGPRNQGLSKDEVRARVRAAMEMLGLPFEFKDRLTEELSQGQRRRLALAGVLALDPQVLVLDEPTAGLDPQGRRELLGMLASWRAKPGHAIVLASHNMEDIAETCSRVYVLAAGRVIFRGAPRDLFSDDSILLQGGLDVPVASQTMLKLRQHGYPVSTQALTLDEAAAQIEGLFDARAV